MGSRCFKTPDGYEWETFCDHCGKLFEETKGPGVMAHFNPDHRSFTTHTLTKHKWFCQDCRGDGIRAVLGRDASENYFRYMELLTEYLSLPGTESFDDPPVPIKNQYCVYCGPRWSFKWFQDMLSDGAVCFECDEITRIHNERTSILREVENLSEVLKREESEILDRMNRAKREGLNRGKLDQLYEEYNGLNLESLESAKKRKLRILDNQSKMLDQIHDSCRRSVT